MIIFMEEAPVTSGFQGGPPILAHTHRWVIKNEMQLYLLFISSQPITSFLRPQPNEFNIFHLTELLNAAPHFQKFNAFGISAE